MVWQLVSVSSFLDSLLRISWALLSQMCAYEITNGTVIVSWYRSVKDRHTALVCGYAVALSLPQRQRGSEHTCLGN